MGSCRICGDPPHPLAEPETPYGLRFGRWIAEPAAGNDGPDGRWCVHSAAAHSVHYEEGYPDGRPFDKGAAVTEARRLEERDRVNGYALPEAG